MSDWERGQFCAYACAAKMQFLHQSTTDASTAATKALGIFSAGDAAMEKSRDLKTRSFQFAIDMVAFYRAVLARDPALRRLACQMLDASTSIGANLEEAAGGQSRADFIAKTCIALKKARESRYWLRLIAACGPGLAASAEPLTAESTELVAMLIAAVNTARRNAAGARQRTGIA